MACMMKISQMDNISILYESIEIHDKIDTEQKFCIHFLFYNCKSNVAQMTLWKHIINAWDVLGSKHNS